MNVADIFCCEGGASMGYFHAGWTPAGVDLFVDYTRARYPFPSLKADWREGLRRLAPRAHLLHGSPPCQRYSITANGHDVEHPDLIEPVREAFEETGLPWVIENVVGAPLRDPIELCGCMFDLTAPDEDGVMLHLWRPRLFESNLPLEQPVAGDYTLPRGSGLAVHSAEYHAYPNVAGVYGGARARKPGQTAAEHRWSCKNERKGGYVPRSKTVKQALLGIDWMTVRGMHQALPPAYTRYIGAEAMRILSA